MFFENIIDVSIVYENAAHMYEANALSKISNSCKTAVAFDNCSK